MKVLAMAIEIGFIDYRSRFHIPRLFYSKFSIGVLSSYLRGFELKISIIGGDD